MGDATIGGLKRWAGAAQARRPAEAPCRPALSCTSWQHCHTEGEAQPPTQLGAKSSVTIIAEKAPTGLAETHAAVRGVNARCAIAARHTVIAAIHKLVGVAGGSGSCSTAEAAH